jgi:type III secretion protein N (ATPase)
MRSALGSGSIIGRGQVTSVSQSGAKIAVLGGTSGLSCDVIVTPLGRRLSVSLGSSTLGTVFNSIGDPVERLALPGKEVFIADTREVAARGVHYQTRAPVTSPLDTGIRAVDTLLTCGEGQRLGVFAGAGCGKTTLISMLLAHAEADVYVIALVGERGREVSDFVSRLKHSDRGSRSVIVFATSDESPADRVSAALVATTVAEYFRDQGLSVLLVVDSLTRFARALRDVALANGEPPARRGYPASVFERLPELIERAGATTRGSITAFYTVLLEDEDGADAVGEEAKSLLDGHIYLSSKLAGKGHFPAIDVLRSLSRLFGEVAGRRTQSDAATLRSAMALLEEMQMTLDLGEYKHGVNPAWDRALAMRGGIEAFLQQSAEARIGRRHAEEALHALVR